MTIHIGSAEANAIKIGGADASAVYVGTEKIWPAEVVGPPPDLDGPAHSYWELVINDNATNYTTTFDSGPKAGADISEGDIVILNAGYQGAQSGSILKLWVNDVEVPDPRTLTRDNRTFIYTACVATAAMAGNTSSFKYEKPTSTTSHMMVAAIIPKSAYSIDPPINSGASSGFEPDTGIFIQYAWFGPGEYTLDGEGIAYQQSHEGIAFASGKRIHITMGYGSTYAKSNGAPFKSGVSNSQSYYIGTSSTRRQKLKKKRDGLKDQLRQESEE